MKLNTLARSLALIGIGAQLSGLAGLAWAQSTPPTPAPVKKVERVEITGSSIKRVRDEGALPLQTYSADEIRQMGIKTAEELLDQLGANSANADNATSRNSPFGDETDRLTGGAAFANLRGLGPTGTLVLLNGRRVSTHGMSGGAVDLNAIPMELVERVEILKDGASAIYGTDAIGGVINFILKKDWQGATLRASLTNPDQAGGGSTKRASLSGGYGSLAQQGFNVMASLTVDRNEILRGIDRDWASGFNPAWGLSPDTTSSPHANIIGSGTGTTALNGSGSTVGPTDPTRYTNLNLLAMQGQCDAVPFGVPLAPNVQLWDKFGYNKANSTYRCGTDYGRQYMLRSPVEGANLMTRATFALGDEHTAFVELLATRTDTKGEFTPFQFSTTSNALTHYPVNGPHYLNLANYGANNFDPTKPIAYRLRMWDWGYRTIENTSENRRLAAGVDGVLGRFDYKLGLSKGTAEASSYMHDGYADTNKLIALLASGVYNPFLMPGQEQTAEAKAAIEATKVRGRLFGGKTSLTQFDGTLSGQLMELPAGRADFAVGFDARKEFYGFSGSQTFTCVSTFTAANAALPNSVMGCPGNPSSPDQSREIYAVFGEIIAPVTKDLELQLALRHDRYQQIGSTTNPKLAFKYTPHKDLLFRGSVNTGFRAPTPQQLNLGSIESVLQGLVTDPFCPAGATTCEYDDLAYRSGGNPDLKPESSKQATFGFVAQPMPGLQLFADYWQVKLEDRIRKLLPSFIVTNSALFQDNFVRDANGNLLYIQAGWVNAASSMTKGLDMGLSHSTAFGGGNLTSTLNATKMISHKERLIETAPMEQLVGKWTNGTLYLPWKVSGNVSFKKGDWNSTLSFSYKSGYDDEDRSRYTANEPTQRDISSYTTFNLFTTYTGFKNLTLSAGVINLADKAPPFTWHNADNVVGAGWDPRVADPRGRTLSMSLRYDFK